MSIKFNLTHPYCNGITTIYSAVSKFGENKFPHVWTVFKQLAIPALLSCFYTVWDFYSDSEKTFSTSEFIKVMAPALFFLMWLVGLHERAKKRQSDSESFNSLEKNIETLADAVNQLNTQKKSTVPHSSNAQTLAFSQIMLLEAEGVFNSGHRLAALLQAGVAFEQSVISFARSRKLCDENRFIPLSRLLGEFKPYLSRDEIIELNALREVRNKLAHANEKELSYIANAERILYAYRWAINTLEDKKYSK